MDTKKINDFIETQFEDILLPCQNDYHKLMEKVITAKDKIKLFLSCTSADASSLSDAVNHPSHYNSHPSGIECIEITRHYCFSIGSAIKYLWRAGLKKEAGLDDKKKEIEDLNKAIWFIRDRIKQLGGQNEYTYIKPKK